MHESGRARASANAGRRQADALKKWAGRGREKSRSVAPARINRRAACDDAPPGLPNGTVQVKGLGPPSIRNVVETNYYDFRSTTMLGRAPFEARAGFPQSPDVLTRLPQLESRQFSQGLPCKTPLRTHLQTSDALPPTQQGLKPMNYSQSQMPLLTNEIKQGMNFSFFYLRAETERD